MGTTLDDMCRGAQDEPRDVSKSAMAAPDVALELGADLSQNSVLALE